MTFEKLLSEGRIRKHKTSGKEIQDLFMVVGRDIADAGNIKLSADWRFAIAYNAVLQLSVIPLYCSGYKPMGLGHHFTVFQTLKITMGSGFSDTADYFDSCRNKRNVTEYDRAGEISETQAAQLLKETKKFREAVTEWVKSSYPELMK